MILALYKLECYNNMRALSQLEQAEREKRVLQSVVHEYIRTGKPVGSRSVTASGFLGLSSATIRQVLAKLEQEEMITHPHTSAGRVPTDKGYRAYVDSLTEFQRLAVQEKMRIQDEYETRTREIEDLMNQVSHILSSISHYTGFVTTPKLDQNIFSSLELVPIRHGRVLVAMVTESGLDKHFVINMSLEIPREKLRKISRIVNQNCQGLTLQAVQFKMVELLGNAQREHQEMIFLAEEISREIKKFSVSEIHLDGTSNILSLPEFSKTDELHDFFKIVDEKKMLINLLESELNEEDKMDPLFTQRSAAKKHRSEKEKKKNNGDKDSALPSKNENFSHIHVRIGSENRIRAMQNLSLVSSSYQLADKTVGVLGILGPKRMEYSKMIALVDYISKMVNRLLKEFEKK